MLTAEEFEEMKKHAPRGGKVIRYIFRNLEDPAFLKMAEEIAVNHHEWWNGRGYPAGRKEEEIPLSARIMAIADVFDALTAERCYKKAMPPEQAFEIIREGAGTQFDPCLAEVFLRHREEFGP